MAALQPRHRAPIRVFAASTAAHSARTQAVGPHCHRGSAPLCHPRSRRHLTVIDEGPGTLTGNSGPPAPVPAWLCAGGSEVPNEANMRIPVKRDARDQEGSVGQHGRGPGGRRERYPEECSEPHQHGC